jgi:hypothetical protein
MATAANPLALAAKARRLYTETLLKGLPETVQGVLNGAQRLASEKGDPATLHKRQSAAMDLAKPAQAWLRGLTEALSVGPNTPLGLRTSVSGAHGSGHGGSTNLTLVDDDTIETEILSSRLALSMMDKSSWEFTDLRSRVSHLERQDELGPTDMLRPHVVARAVIDSWSAAGLPLEHWRTLQPTLHLAFGELIEVAYHETNRWLLEEGVKPEMDLRPLIRRSTASAVAPITPVTSGFAELDAAGAGGRRTAPASGSGGGVGEETRLMTRMNELARTAGQAEAVLARLNKLVGRQVPQFEDTARADSSMGLKRAIADAQAGLQRHLGSTARDAGPISTPALVQDLQQRKQALKQAASTPVERATIEIVALLFQSILTEERIPAAVRVWFARLQMPVLRVALSEPEFFGSL